MMTSDHVFGAQGVFVLSPGQRFSYAGQFPTRVVIHQHGEIVLDEVAAPGSQNRFQAPDGEPVTMTVTFCDPKKPPRVLAAATRR